MTEDTEDAQEMRVELYLSSGEDTKPLRVTRGTYARLLAWYQTGTSRTHTFRARLPLGTEVRWTVARAHLVSLVGL